mmetsp:Transcript_14860/g.42824  ORF Transcript_14860/g.42824 Transcript_14860/m.42824 type:complete len:255 (+) Transcript_14860:705-1469(+)
MARRVQGLEAFPPQRGVEAPAAAAADEGLGVAERVEAKYGGGRVHLRGPDQWLGGLHQHGVARHHRAPARLGPPERQRHRQERRGRHRHALPQCGGRCHARDHALEGSRGEAVAHRRTIGEGLREVHLHGAGVDGCRLEPLLSGVRVVVQRDARYPEVPLRRVDGDRAGRRRRRAVPRDGHHRPRCGASVRDQQRVAQGPEHMAHRRPARMEPREVLHARRGGVVERLQRLWWEVELVHGQAGAEPNTVPGHGR